MDTDSLESLILSNSLLNQNAEMWPAPYNFLHLEHIFS